MLPRILVIVGPTAVGKSSMAIRLAEQLDGEIISADSRYFYIGMDIGTAKPSLEELSRIKHHLINVTTPDHPWSLSLFQEKAEQAINATLSENKIPILVGGTGQYIRAVTESWQVPGLPPDPNLRSVLTDWGMKIGSRQLHAKLQMIDPVAASRMDPGNLRRSVRALEVIFSTGVRFSEQSRQSEPVYEIFTIGLRRPRAELFACIDERIEAMFSQGFVEEVQWLLGSGYSSDLPAMSAIGYREVVDYLSGRATRAEAIMLIKRNTRQYVRRQANWFKETDPTIHWFDMQPDPLPEIFDACRRWLAEGS